MSYSWTAPPTEPPVPALSLFSCSFQLLEFKSKLRLSLTVNVVTGKVFRTRENKCRTNGIPVDMRPMPRVGGKTFRASDPRKGRLLGPPREEGPRSDMKRRV